MIIFEVIIGSEMNKTLNSFKNDISNSDRIKKKILENIKQKKENEIVLNTVQLNFDFLKENVEISYFMIDEAYPDITLNFEELKKLITVFENDASPKGLLFVQ